VKGAEQDPLPRYVGMVVAVGALGFLAAYLVPRGQPARWATFIGVAEATASGAAALSLKKWALGRSLKASLAMLGGVFALRLILAVSGLAYVKVKSGAVLPFVAGFFGTYFVLQWVEISYVLAEAKRHGHGGF
jgi:hypothetical protein